jgi:ABC-2 type transport system permease protein
MMMHEIATAPRDAARGRSRLDKYVAFAVLSFRQRVTERAAVWGRVLFYFIILLTFASLWEALLTGGGASGRGERAAENIWYLAVTEWVMLSQPALYLEIETDVRNGDVAYLLARPASYVGSKLAAAAGDLALRLVVLGPAGLCLGRLFSGVWPSAEGLLLAALVGLVASGILLLSYAAVGLAAFWVHDCTSIYLVWQKLLFVLGGLLLPLDIYPPWLRTLADHSPFPALLYGAGSLVMNPDPARALRLALELLLWGLAFLLIVLALERRGRRAINLYGG